MRLVSQLPLTFLLNACWQIALVAVSAVLAERLLARAGARSRHLIWVAALLLSICLPIVAIIPGKGTARVASPAPKPVESQAAILTATVTATDLTPNRFALLEPSETVASTPSNPSRFFSVSRGIANLFLAIFAAFLCYRAMRLFQAWRGARNIIREAHPVNGNEFVQSIFMECLSVMRVSRARLLYSQAVTVPVTIGIVRPAVVLPEHLLQESDRSLLMSAVGHELVHVLRRDYLLNLIYELIYLPLSFHPAAMLVRRRIRQTRELGCDELVTEKLIDARSYARSLVRLASSALPSNQAAAITVGINDADILEERIMKMLNRTKLTARKRNLLLLATALLLAVPCAAAVPFAMGINISSLDGKAVAHQQETKAPPTEGSASEGFNVVMPELADGAQSGTIVGWLKRPGDPVQQGEAVAKINNGKSTIALRAGFAGVVSQVVVKLGDPAPAGAVLAVVKPQQDQEAAAKAERQRVREELEAIRRAEMEAKKNLAKAQELDAEARTQAEAAAREQLEVARRKALTLSEGTIGISVLAEDSAELRARRRAEREQMAKEQSELAKESKIAMHQAIQIATNLYPGAVVESRLARERNQPCYILSILSDAGGETTVTRVLMSAVDGTIIKTFKEER